MKRMIPIILGMLAVSTSVFSQTAEETIERALAAAPRQMRDGATVIKWKADYTYETLKKGTNRLLCYDRSWEPGRQPFAVQCTSISNLDRVAQNRKFEAMSDMAARQSALDAVEANGTRVKPEYGSVWYDMNGADQAHARIHHDCRTGRYNEVNRTARQSQAGWRMDYECGHNDRAHHDTRQLENLLVGGMLSIMSDVRIR